MSPADDDDSVDPASSHYPPAKMTPAEFEKMVVDQFRSAAGNVDNLNVQLHEVIGGVDGSFDFDGTARFEVAGVRYLTLIEAKAHKDAIKRELVQILHSKMLSVGAQKGVLYATAPFQRGALDFAMKHGIALITVTEGRFTYERKSQTALPPISRAEAKEWFGLPEFVAVSVEPSASGGTRTGVLRDEDGKWFAKHIMGVPSD